MSKDSLDSRQAASAAQFDRQSDRYGKSHILADTQDVAQGLTGVLAHPGAKALDVATGGGHTALWLARHGWEVTAGDVAARMLENAQKLCAEAGFKIEARLFPAEEMPFGDASFELVTVRVAPHHFSSPTRFVQETGRVLKQGGHFLLIDGSVPDDDPETDEWLHWVEKWRDPSHGRLLSRKAWEQLVREAGMEVVRSELHSLKQPDLDWYFDTAATTPENREKVLESVRTASDHVRRALRLGRETGKIVWWWPRLTLLALKERTEGSCLAGRGAQDTPRARSRKSRCAERLRSENARPRVGLRSWLIIRRAPARLPTRYWPQRRLALRRWISKLPIMDETARARCRS